MKSIVVALALSASFMVVILSGSAAHAEEKKTAPTKPAADVVVTVQAGDTLTSIADANGVTYVQLFNANDAIANPDVIDVGDQIKVPQASETLPDRFSGYEATVAAAEPAYQPTTTTSSSVTQSYTPTASTNSSSYYTGNGMWCTDYVHSRRPDIPIYGNAGYNWISAAQAAGKATGTTPQAGAIAVMSGHVAYVESVNADGSYVVSEMGWNYQAGNYNIRTVWPGAFGAFIY